MSTTIPDQLPPSRRQSSIMIIAAVMALLLIIAGAIGLFVSHNNQVSQDHIHVTATKVQMLANNHSTTTAVSQQNATDTVFAIPGLTATAFVTSPYAPFTTLSLDDALTLTDYDWSNGPNCRLSTKGYVVSVTRAFYIDYCTDAINQYSEMAYRVTMTIRTGDCGGLVFGYIDVNNLYLFEVCQNGTYNMYSHLKGEWISLYPSFSTSSEIRKGTNVQNSIAITIKGNIITMYVNGKKIDTAKDFDFTGKPIRNGEIGLFADNRGSPTSVIYVNSMAWTV